MAEDLTGTHFGKWTVLAPSEKPHYYTCQCECGVVKDVYDSSLRLGKSRSCLSCANRGQKPAMTETALRKAKKKEGQIINGWKVLEVLPEKRSGCFLCRAICPKCGKETTVKITRLSRIQHCADCNRDIGEKTWQFTVRLTRMALPLCRFAQGRSEAISIKIPLLAQMVCVKTATVDGVHISISNASNIISAAMTRSKKPLRPERKPRA